MKVFRTAKGELRLDRPYLMGILNVTPDSFSDGGLYNDAISALAKAEEMAAQGADLIDVGAVSTRPFSAPVSEEEEWARLSAVLPELLRICPVPVSVDTTTVSVARRCLDLGVAIINDVSGAFRPELGELIKEYRAGWVLMHGGAALAKTEAEIDYPEGVVRSVQAFFDDVISQAAANGLPVEQLCLDPGFGFAKNVEQNVELLKNLSSLHTHGAALMAALSRKRFIGAISGDDDPADRLGGTLAANVMAVRAGAQIIRSHEITLHRKALDFAFAV
ncbi:MAG: dihydropteroate synthase [Clostridia bacterium]|nr:dihydropteroate synthase [Clostridia bacterium]